MRDHLAHQLVLSGLDGNWIRLDEMFRRRIRRHAELKAAGQTIDEEPKIAEEYLRNIEILAEQENVPFFAELWRQLHPEAEVAPGNAPTRKPISKTYVEEFINRHFPSGLPLDFKIA